MTRYHTDTNAQTGVVTTRPFTQEEEDIFDAEASARESPANNPLTARQLRLGLVRNNVSLSAVQTAINNLPTQSLRDEAQIYWEFSTEINWDHPMTQTLMAMVGLSVNTATVMWTTARTYMD